MPRIQLRHFKHTFGDTQVLLKYLISAFKISCHYFSSSLVVN